MARESTVPRLHEHGRYAQLDDTELVVRAATEPDAFEELYRRHAPRVYRYVLTYVGSPEDAADLTQHVFLRCYQCLPQYQNRGPSFSSWLIKIARNAATDAHRRRRAALPWDHVPEAAHPVMMQDLESAVLRVEILNQLRLMIGRLSADKQEILALRFAAELTAAEIGAVVGKSEAAVQKQLQRIVGTLREEWHALEI
jgi:RNA polymerase sigma-70 factor, ECF subfamily